MEQSRSDEIANIVHRVVKFLFRAVRAGRIVPNVLCKFPDGIGTAGSEADAAGLQGRGDLADAVEDLVMGGDGVEAALAADAGDGAGVGGRTPAGADQ